VLREGTDAVLFGYGPVLLHEALSAAEILEKEGFSLKVVNMPWLNRVDQSWFVEMVRSAKAVFVLDNHSPYGGLGDLLLNTANSADNEEVGQIHKFGVEGYPACGTPLEALEFHGVDGQGISRRILEITQNR
jgi:transketolase